MDNIVELTSTLDLTNDAIAADYKRWQEEDGTAEGLRALVKKHDWQPGDWAVALPEHYDKYMLTCGETPDGRPWMGRVIAVLTHGELAVLDMRIGHVFVVRGEHFRRVEG